MEIAIIALVISAVDAICNIIRVVIQISDRKHKKEVYPYIF